MKKDKFSNLIEYPMSEFATQNLEDLGKQFWIDGIKVNVLKDLPLDDLLKLHLEFENMVYVKCKPSKLLVKKMVEDKIDGCILKDDSERPMFKM